MDNEIRSHHFETVLESITFLIYRESIKPPPKKNVLESRTFVIYRESEKKGRVPLVRNGFRNHPPYVFPPKASSPSLRFGGEAHCQDLVPTTGAAQIV